jgi:hypothetical protein
MLKNSTMTALSKVNVRGSVSRGMPNSKTFPPLGIFVCFQNLYLSLSTCARQYE